MTKKFWTISFRLFFLLGILFSFSNANAGDSGGPAQSADQAGNTNQEGPPKDPNKGSPDPCNEQGQDPIDLAHGEFKTERTDLVLPGLRESLPISFQYRNQKNYNGRWGFGWFFPHEQRLFLQKNGNVLWRIGTGEQQVFTKSGNTFISPASFHITLTKLGNGGYQLLVKNGIKYVFSSEGLLIQSFDRANNLTAFAYETNAGGAKIKSPLIGPNGNVIALDYRLLSITSTLGKNVYFAYYGSQDGLKNGRIKQISDDYGRTVQYDYDNKGNLTLVISPSTTFQDANGSTVTRGRATSYTYSSGFGSTKLGAPEDFRNHNLLTETDDKGQTYLANYYDDNDRVIKQEHSGGTATLSYTLSGDVVTQTDETDGNGVLRRHYFNTQGRETQLLIYTSGVHPGLSSYLSYTYQYNSCCSELNLVQNPLNNGIIYSYDAEGNVIEERRKTYIFSGNTPSDIVTSYSYVGAFNQVKTMTDPLGRLTTYFYDFEEASLGDLNGDGITNQAVGNLVKIVYPNATLADGSSQTAIEHKFWYNNFGQKIREIKPAGNIVVWNYFPAGDPSFGLLKEMIVDPTSLNFKTSYTYDSFGYVNSVKDPRQNTVSFTNNALGEVLNVLAPLGVQTKQSYDGNGNLAKREVRNLDENGQVQTPEWIATRFEYDFWDRLKSRTEDVSNSAGPVTTRTTQFSYDAVGNLKFRTSPEGNVESWDYDERNLSWRHFMGYGTPDQVTEILHVDANGNTTQFINGNGKLTTTTFDLFDRPIAVVDPVSNRRETDYNNKSEVTENRLLNPGSILLTKTQFEWDELGRRRKVKAVNTQGAGSNDSQFFYDKNSRMTKTVSARGFATQYFYDNADRVSLVSDALGNSRLFQYDENSNLRFINETELVSGSPNELYQSEFKYDALNRRIEARRYDRLNAPHQPFSTYFYDSRSNLVKQVDEIGRTMRSSYDLLSRPILKIEDQGGLTIPTFSVYDNDDRQVQIIDAAGRPTSYIYDSLDRLREIHYASGPGEFFSYDGAGNLKTQTAQDGVITTFNYYDNDLLQNRNAGFNREEFVWNALRRPTSAKALYNGSQTSLVTLSYDGFGRVKDEVQDSYTAHHEYDADNQLNLLSYPSGLSLTMNYDALDRLSSVSGPGLVANYSYAGVSRVKTRTSNVTQTNTWDGLRRLTRMTSGSVVDFGYNYDDVDRKSYEQRFHEAGKGDVYQYDGVSRLKDIWYNASNPSAGSGGFNSHLQLNLDPVEDRLSTIQDGATTNYNTPDPLHRYTQIGAIARQYDLKGNLTDDGTYLFEYDPWNRLTKVNLKSSGAELARYEHDAMGRRAKRVAGSTTNRYVYSGPRLLSDYEDSGGGYQLKNNYLYGAGMDELLAIDNGGQRYFVHQDSLGSTAAITNSAGSVIERYHYDSFGNPSVTNAGGVPIVGANGLPKSSIDNLLWFTAARFDQESGYYHMRARQYEPKTGRFISRDPIGYVNGPNPYTYTNSSPTNWVDPFGLEKNTNKNNNKNNNKNFQGPDPLVPSFGKPLWEQKEHIKGWKRGSLPEKSNLGPLEFQIFKWKGTDTLPLIESWDSEAGLFLTGPTLEGTVGFGTKIVGGGLSYKAAVTQWVVDPWGVLTLEGSVGVGAEAKISPQTGIARLGAQALLGGQVQLDFGKLYDHLFPPPTKAELKKMQEEAQKKWDELLEYERQHSAKNPYVGRECMSPGMPKRLSDYLDNGSPRDWSKAPGSNQDTKNREMAELLKYLNNQK